MQLSASSHSSEELFESICEAIDSVNLMTLATIMSDNASQPWVNTAYYCRDDSLNLYYLSPPDAIHSKNIQMHAASAVNIIDWVRTGNAGKIGLQMQGRTHQATGDALNAGLVAYQKRFVGFDKTISTPEDFDKGIIESKLFVFSPERIKIFDEARFGEEVWITATVAV